jgi:hypothetical protein
MTTNNKAVTCYLPKDIEDFITGYCIEYAITRKDKEGNIYPSLGTGIIELLKLLAYNPELVSSPILDTVPSKFSEDAIEKKIDEILEKKLSNHLPDNVPSIEVVKDRLDNWVLAASGDIKDINQRSLQVDHQIASIKSRLDNMERLLRLQQSASIASPIPTGEPSPNEPNAIEAAIDSLFGDTSPATPPSLDAIENAIETAIKPTIGDEPAIEVPSAKKKGLTDSELARHLGIDKSNITRWKQRGKPTPKYKDWELIGRLWYKKSETKD